MYHAYVTCPIIACIMEPKLYALLCFSDQPKYLHLSPSQTKKNKCKCPCLTTYAYNNYFFKEKNLHARDRTQICTKIMQYKMTVFFQSD